jgi:hypothetical protein
LECSSKNPSELGLDSKIALWQNDIGDQWEVPIMPLSPVEAESKTKQHRSILTEKLIIEYARKIDDRLATSFSISHEKYQINLNDLKNSPKIVQDAVLEHLKKEYEAVGWKVWYVQEKVSQEFCFTLELIIKKD